MNEPSLGRLEQVALRTIWADEAGDFTPWLARPENLKLLGETLGIELEPESEEVAVGPFWADIVCRDTATGGKVVVENQVERTDHVHLGQILTYVAGVGAQTVVWIASRFTNEHRAALDWLNEHTMEEISFFGLEVELWRIGNSAPAPKFNVVSKPNDWSKAVRQQTGAGSSRNLTDDKRIQFEFWTEFKSWLEERTKFRVRAPGYHSWLTVPIGRRDFHLNLIASFWNKQTNTFEMPEIRVDLVMQSPRAKEQFAILEGRRAEIEKQIGTTLVFHNEKESQRCRIYVRRDCDFRDRSKWNEAFEWLAKYLQLFSDVFRPLIREL